MTLRILGQRVLVQPDTRQIEAPAEIVLPDNAAMVTAEVSGTVTDIGPGVTTVSIGDRVLFSPQAGFEVEIGKARYLVIPEEQLMAVHEQDH